MCGRTPYSHKQSLNTIFRVVHEILANYPRYYVSPHGEGIDVCRAQSSFFMSQSESVQAVTHAMLSVTVTEPLHWSYHWPSSLISQACNVLVLASMLTLGQKEKPYCQKNDHRNPVPVFQIVVFFWPVVCQTFSAVRSDDTKNSDQLIPPLDPSQTHTKDWADFRLVSAALSLVVTDGWSCLDRFNFISMV